MVEVFDYVITFVVHLSQIFAYNISIHMDLLIMYLVLSLEMDDIFLLNQYRYRCLTLEEDWLTYALYFLELILR